VAAQGLGAARPDAAVQALHLVDRVAGPNAVVAMMVMVIQAVVVVVVLAFTVMPRRG